MGHIKKHSIVVGDVVKTISKFFADNPGDIVSLAYFDMATYAPTKACLEAVLPHAVPGSVFLMDELNFSDYDGASIAFKEVFAGPEIQDQEIEIHDRPFDCDLVVRLTSRNQ